MLARLIGVAVLLSVSSTAFADPPSIGDISPAGVPRGTATEVTISGGGMNNNPTLVAPFPFTIDPPAGANADAGKWKIKLLVPPSVPVGVHAIRVRTDDGLSNPFLVAVGQLPQEAEKEPNSTYETAQAIASPVIVEGSAAGNDVDFFRFPGKKGARIVIDAQCARIGSGVDPQIRLMTAGRKFLASADDTPGLATDARLVTVLPEDGDYVIELSDTRYMGGARPVYRLTVGEVPTADEVYPLGGRRGETVGFELRGGTLTEAKVAAATLAVPSPGDSFRLQVPARAIGLGDSAFEVEMSGPVHVDDLAELRESTDPTAPPVKGTPPVVFNGRIDAPGDDDRFAVAVTPGQSIRVEVHAADLGSALDGTLQVLDPKGAVVAQADDTTVGPVGTRSQRRNAPGLTSPDPSLTYAVPAGVTELTIALRDLEGRGGVGFPYRIHVEPATPTFDVALTDSQVNVRQGGTAAVPVTVVRQGYNGPITLAVDNLPAGLTVRPGTVHDGQLVGTFSISAAADANVGPTTLEVVGTAQGPGGPIKVRAEKLVVFAQQGPVPVNFRTQVGLAASTARPGSVSLDAPAAVEIAHGVGGPIPIKVARKPGQDAAMTVKPLPLPPGVAFADQPIPEKVGEANLNVGVALEAPLGSYTIALNATGKFGGKDETNAVPAITLNVVRPASLALAAPSVEIKAGGTIEVKGTVARKAPFNEPVTVRVDGLPAGLKAEPVTVAPGAGEFTLKVVADAGAAAAMAEAKVLPAYKVGGKDYPNPATPLAVKVVK